MHAAGDARLAAARRLRGPGLGRGRAVAGGARDGPPVRELHSPGDGEVAAGGASGVARGARRGRPMTLTGTRRGTRRARGGGSGARQAARIAARRGSTRRLRRPGGGKGLGAAWGAGALWCCGAGAGRGGWRSCAHAGEQAGKRTRDAGGAGVVGCEASHPLRAWLLLLRGEAGFTAGGKTKRTNALYAADASAAARRRLRLMLRMMAAGCVGCPVAPPRRPAQTCKNSVRRGSARGKHAGTADRSKGAPEAPSPPGV